MADDCSLRLEIIILGFLICFTVLKKSNKVMFPILFLIFGRERITIEIVGWEENEILLVSNLNSKTFAGLSIKYNIKLIG